MVADPTPRPSSFPDDPPIEPDPEERPERPLKGPGGKRTPYPVSEPDLDDLPGSVPDYEPGRPIESPPAI